MEPTSYNPTKQEIRNFILASYQRQLKPMEIVKEGQIKFGPRGPAYITVSRWYRRFQAGDFSLKDEKREGRPKVHSIISTLIQKKIDEDPRTTNKAICAEIGVFTATVGLSIKNELNYVKHAGRFVPRHLSNELKTERLQFAKACLELYKLNSINFLDRFITAGELCVHRKLTQTVLEPVDSVESLPEVKTLWATIIWHSRGILITDYYEKRDPNYLLHFFELLEKLRNDLLSNMPDIFEKKVLFHYDISAIHGDKAGLTSKLFEIGFDQLAHPLQSPDLSPCDFFLFENLRKWLTNRNFKTNADVIDCIHKYFNEFSESYFTDGLKQMESRWLRLIELDGEYIDDSF